MIALQLYTCIDWTVEFAINAVFFPIEFMHIHIQDILETVFLKKVIYCTVYLQALILADCDYECIRRRWKIDVRSNFSHVMTAIIVVHGLLGIWLRWFTPIY